MFRVEDYPSTDEVKKIIIMTCTNNLSNDKDEAIVNTIVRIRTVLQQKFKTADIWIMAITPRLLVQTDIRDKIVNIDRESFNRCDIFFFDAHREFSTRKGKIR